MLVQFDVMKNIDPNEYPYVGYYNGMVIYSKKKMSDQDLKTAYDSALDHFLLNYALTVSEDD